jgi:three-Cys-motif partner protein
MGSTAPTCNEGGPTKDNGNCTNPGPDGLPVQCVGRWAEDEKHGYLRWYIDATRQARRKYLMPGSHGAPGGAGYVDLFAGPGKVRVRETGEIFDGSPLIALGFDKARFTRVVLCDLDEENVSTLRTRTESDAERVQIFHGNCNEIAQQLVEALPRRGLNLAFVDPFKLDQLHFATLRTLAQLERIDLVVNFPTQDVRRNLGEYSKPDNQILDRALGTRTWRDHVRSTGDVHRAVDILIEQLEGLGYTGTRNRTVSVKQRTNVELYRLVFASKHPLADKIWASITKHTPLGQRGFDFD